MAIRIGAALALLAAAGVLAYLFLRPPVEAVSASDADVTIQCSAATGASMETCGAWGDEILAGGAPSTTFEMDDLARLVIDRPAWGFSPTCEVDYFISRDAENRAWHEAIACVDTG
ncbi:MAG TPA: hypothetical protein VEW95_08380 [Candidatus Limnocylindrales bacterium]|nr:hypothetical protein [Candidatus Limnocylindrales bacterium]